jgi:hypothetical protein
MSENQPKRKLGVAPMAALFCIMLAGVGIYHFQGKQKINLTDRQEVTAPAKKFGDAKEDVAAPAPTPSFPPVSTPQEPTPVPPADPSPPSAPDWRPGEIEKEGTPLNPTIMNPTPEATPAPEPTPPPAVVEPKPKPVKPKPKKRPKTEHEWHCDWWAVESRSFAKGWNRVLSELGLDIDDEKLYPQENCK